MTPRSGWGDCVATAQALGGLFPQWAGNRPLAVHSFAMMVLAIIVAIALAVVVVRSTHGRLRWGCLAALAITGAVIALLFVVLAALLAGR